MASPPCRSGILTRVPVSVESFACGSCPALAGDVTPPRAGAVTPPRAGAVTSERVAVGRLARAGWYSGGQRRACTN